MNFNKIILVGRLTRDPELKYTEENDAFCKFRIAVNPSTGSRQRESSKALFLEVLVWKGSAEACKEHLTKGQTVLVDGSLQSREWNNEEGVKQVMLQIFANRVEFGPKANGKKEDPPEKDEAGIPF